MTFPPGPPDGRSLPTWGGRRQEMKGTESGSDGPPNKLKGAFRTFRSHFRVAIIPKKKPTAISKPQPSNEGPFRLLALPRELRDRIYDLLISDPGADPCDKFEPPFARSFAARPLFYNLEYNACLLATNRQIQHEFAQMLCLRKERSAVPAATAVIHEAVRHQDRGPYYHKNYRPIPVHVGHLAFFGPFAQFLQSVEVRMEYSPLPGRTPWDPEATIPDDVQINLTGPLIAALRPGRRLRSVRIRLHLSTGRFELGWVSREMERFKAIPGFELVQLDVTKLVHLTCSMTHTLWALPREDGAVGWRHIEEDIDFFYRWRGPHASGRDGQCFECWRQVQREGGEVFPGFEGEEHVNESFLKLRKLEAPAFTWDDWRRWKMPAR